MRIKNLRMCKILALFVVLWVACVPHLAQSQGLPCDDTSATTTSAGLDSFLDSITTGGASASNPRVVCLTASTITLTSQVSWTVPDHVVLIGLGDLNTLGGGSTTTTFVDNFSPSPGGNCGSSCDSLQFSSIDGYFRMAGFKYVVNVGTTSRNNAPFVLGGNSTQVRLDHFTYDATPSGDEEVHWMYIGGCLRGLIDHAVFTVPNDIAWVHFVNGSCDTGGVGNVSWTEPTNFGSSAFFFMEDSTWTATGSASLSGGTVTDCTYGGKFVIRFNTILNASIGQTHPTLHSGNARGCRAHEIYGNTINTANASWDPSYAIASVNSGGAIWWGNSVGNNTVERLYQTNNCRQSNLCGYTPTATPDNWGPCGTAYNGTGSNWDRNDDATTGRPCIDNPGRGAGDLITGEFPSKINSRTGTIAWPLQVLEPVYEWNTTGTATEGTTLTNLSSGRVQLNVDIYMGRGNSSCNPGAGSCTAGVGVGTLAQRPANCTTGAESGGGVGWWATDQGSWNESTSNPQGVQQNGADGVLYRCSATNTWTIHYTPYTYPHPLQNAVAAGPVPTVIRLVR